MILHDFGLRDDPSVLAGVIFLQYCTALVKNLGWVANRLSFIPTHCGVPLSDYCPEARSDIFENIPVPVFRYLGSHRLFYTLLKPGQRLF